MAEQTPHGPEEIARRKSVIAGGETDVTRWSDPGQLEAAWNRRAEIAAQFIPAGARIMDIGCGAMALEGFLPAGCAYQPCDVVARDERTLVLDLNHQAPPADLLAGQDRITMLGVLEYLYDPLKTLRSLAAAGKPLVLSYCAADWSASLDRRGLGWVNDLTLADLERLFAQAGFAIRRAERIDGIQALFLLDPKPVATKPAKRVLVLSYGNVGNFGDRLGYHLIHSVLPPHAVVTHGFFKPWTVPDEDYDLLVLGIGNSLFAPLVDDQLLRLMDRIPRKVGIFGTQYRDEFPPERLAPVLDRLDHWFARYEEDVLLYGRGRSNVSHLGDWLVHAFPMARGGQEKPLTIGNEIWNDLPLDRVIQRIQSYRVVHSTRLHPLLCALTSAEQVAYQEQRENARKAPSGKFRSLLVDVFGRNMPEGQLWPVDRAAVLRYKTRVAAGVHELADWLDKALA